MIENILDANGNIIGTLELPDGTDSSVVSAQLALYTYTVPTPTAQQVVATAIESAVNFGYNLIQEFAVQNVLAGITQAGQTIPVANYVSQLNYYLNTGSLYAAITTINGYIADTSSTKTSLSPFITNAVLYTYLNKIQAYLQIPLTANPGT